MKHTLLMLCLLMGSVTFAQIPGRPGKKVTVILTNISLEEALTILSTSYGVLFSYSDDVIPTQTLINLTIQDENLDSAIEKLLKPYFISYIDNKKQSYRVAKKSLCPYSNDSRNRHRLRYPCADSGSLGCSARFATADRNYNRRARQV